MRLWLVEALYLFSLGISFLLVVSSLLREVSFRGLFELDIRLSMREFNCPCSDINICND